MSSKSYSEQRQAILFRASRDLRAVACSVLDDVQNEVELTGSTPAWAKSVALATATLANELEGRGHEETMASARAESDLARSKDHYSMAIDAFEARIKAANPA